MSESIVDKIIDEKMYLQTVLLITHADGRTGEVFFETIIDDIPCEFTMKTFIGSARKVYDKLQAISQKQKSAI